MATTDRLAKPIKTQIIVNLQALVAAGLINSYYSIDLSTDPLSMEPTAGYPFAIVGMPRIASDFEDQATNIRTYRFDVLFVLDPTTLANPDTNVEDLIDAVLNQSDSNYTLAGVAEAAVLPATIEGAPVSTDDKTLLVFVLTLQGTQTLLYMSLRAPRDKIIKAPPSKKGFHFASDGVHEAMFVEAASIEEAEAIYHKAKKPMVVGGTESTAPPAAEGDEKEVQ